MELIGHHQHLEARLYATVIHAPASFWRSLDAKWMTMKRLCWWRKMRRGLLVIFLPQLASAAPVYEVRTVGMIFDLMVSPRVRGGGIGRKLVDAASTEFARRGIMDLQVNYDPRNEEANGFWQAMGFQTLLHEAYRQNS